MHISTDWIKDFVELPTDLTSKEVATRFTLGVAEVEGVIVTGEFLDLVKVVQIKSLRKHPEADKLNLVTFDLGAGVLKEVVCGAPNVREGLKVPYASVGTVLPGGLKLEPKNIRGYVSEGMLCSEVELQLGEGKSGLLELPEATPVGQSMAEYLGVKKDVLLDVDNKSLTHRPDLWGHYGMAREFATLFQKTLKNPFDTVWTKGLESKFNIALASPLKPKVEPGSSCLAYWALSVDGVVVGQSPKWMQDRLTAVGMRPINSIVDISNYVMLELGIPLHIFDREQIAGNTLFIRKASDGEKFVTLDENERVLTTQDTVIADAQQSLVLAGIMGGLHSGVTGATTKIMIEVANWKAPETRKTSTRLGLRTESSQRYEKSLDSNLCYRTLLRTLELILKFCPTAHVIGRPEYDGEDLKKTPVISIATSAEKISRVLGKNISENQLMSIFVSLDFKVERSGHNLIVTLPSYRTTKDMSCEADLVEEIGRMIGFDNIAAVSPVTEVRPVRFDQKKILYRKIQDFLCLKSNAHEVLTYPLVGEKLLAKASWPAQHSSLVLKNALSVENDRMRPSLIPSFLEAVSHNVKNFDSFSLFELGRAYLADEKNFSNERSHLVFASFSKSESTYVETINQAEKLFASLNFPTQLTTEKGKFSNSVVALDWAGLHPYEFLNVRLMGKFMGAIFTVHPLVLREFKIKGHLSLLVLDITDVENATMKDKTKYRPLAKFPSSSFDCSVVVGKDVPAAVTTDLLAKLKLQNFVSSKIVTVYPLEDGRKSVTIRTIFEDESATLSAEFLKSSEQKIVSELERAGYPLKN